MSLVVVMYFGAGNALRGIEISMFWFYQTLFDRHFQIYIAAAGTKSCKTMQTLFFPENCYVKDNEMQNWKICHHVRPHSYFFYCTWFLKITIWGRGKYKFLYRSKFYTHEYKNHHSEPEIYLLNICIQIKWTYKTLFETWTNIWRKVAPHENPENTPPPPPPQKKNRNFLISTSNYQRYTKFTCTYVFEDDKKDDIFKKKLCIT